MSSGGRADRSVRTHDAWVTPQVREACVGRQGLRPEAHHTREGPVMHAMRAAR